MESENLYVPASSCHDDQKQISRGKQLFGSKVDYQIRVRELCVSHDWSAFYSTVSWFVKLTGKTSFPSVS